jgi:ABC-type transport system substrate-binding protein
LKSWEKIEYQDRPEIPIEFDIANYATNPGINFNGWDGYYANIGPFPQYLSYGSKTSMTVETTGDFEQMLPSLTSSYYDLEVYNPVYDYLFVQAYPAGFPNSAPSAPSQVLPDLASGVDISGNILTYHLKSANFQDGTPFTANDVLFSLLAYSDYNSGSISAALLTSYLGNKVTFTWENGTSTELDTNNTAGVSWYGPSGGASTVKPDSPVRGASVVATDAHTVAVTLGNFQGLSTPAATFHPEIDNQGLAMLPMDYLQTIDVGCISQSATPCGWGSSIFNTATGGTYTSNGVTFSGPFGTGPYSFVNFDPVSQTAHLSKFNGYWNASGLSAMGEFTLRDYYLKYVSTAAGAISDLKNGVADAIDPQFHYAVNVAEGQLSFAKVYKEPLAGQQEIGINMQHPVIGTGVQTPNGQKDPAHAAAYARDVRQAFDYLIPRDQIIANLLVGSAEPGDVPFASGGYK